jgi:hypothetical protein
MARILTYDGLRGWLLIIIACNHLYGSFVSDFTRAPFGFVSAAEAFVFLSGFVAYFVYQRLDASPINQTKKIVHRTLIIYGFHLLAIAITFTLVTTFPYYQTLWTEFFLAGNFFSSPIQFSLASIFLLEHPGYHDILIMYLVAMAFLPMAMWSLKKDRWLLVLITSITLWYIAPSFELTLFSELYHSLFPDLTIQVSTFDPLAWQLYFYIGVLLSYAKFNRKVSFDLNPKVHWILFTCTLLLMLGKHAQVSWFQSLIQNTGNAPVLIVINLLLLCYVFSFWMRKWPYLFTLKYPVFLGQHALPVFSFHTIVIYFLLPVTHELTNASWYWDLAVCVFFVALLWFPAKLDLMYHQAKKQYQSTGKTITNTKL